jgi:hypothetical protein
MGKRIVIRTANRRNGHVYELYELTEEEIKIVEGVQ